VARGRDDDTQSPDGPDLERAARVLGQVRVRLEEMRTLSLGSLAEQTGLERETIERLFAAAGRLHDDKRYGARDLAYARDVAELLERFDVQVLERALRLHQRAVTTIAVNQLALVQADRRMAPLLEKGRGDDRLAGLLTREARETIALVQRLLVEDHQETLLRLLDTQAVARASRTLGEVIDMAVAFVDLVGFTRLSASVDPDEVGDTLSAFEDLVHSEADRAGEVLVVKFIGDAAMLVGGDADEVADAAMGIVEADDVPGLDGVGRRAGLGAGEMRVRDGDYVGNAVNVAARLTDLARPDSLVVDEGAVERMDDHWRRSRLPSTKIKGLGRSRPVRVRRPAALDEEAAGRKSDGKKSDGKKPAGKRSDGKSKGKSEKKG
jgi:adenylate cyclase